MPDSTIFDLLHKNLGENLDNILLPPPVFKTMRGEFLKVDLAAGTLSTRFPVLGAFLNPYGSMQGGMVAAAVDNTIGPLSMLVAPPSVTRRLEMKYGRPVTMDLNYITVKAEFKERKGRQLEFSAKVVDDQGKLLARAHAVHYIIDESKDNM